ncbi:MAG: N-acetylmuramoyl-L-alanine amidase [Bacteroidia bacterium]|nr:N-acetylmuramoyl-L-alanine amidase [Bacteroidia bacterium]
MKTTKTYIVFSLACLGLLFFPHLLFKTWGKDFVVVIDAGHGGHDPGAVGRVTKEKVINLKVALKLGALINQHCEDVKVVYTRKSDVFIPLDRRADIANEAKADLFISIHTNALANNRTFTGASTWTLGLAKSDANLEVAKRENSVILYESDYKTRYAGFNPNSAESYIIFEFMQDKYMEQSVHLASLIQKQFGSTCRRLNRGVHQAGFLVLKASAMPSVLVELGFISTPQEEDFLNSETGASSMSRGLFNAFLTYKREQELRLTGKSRTVIPKEAEEEKPSLVAATEHQEKKSAGNEPSPAPTKPDSTKPDSTRRAIKVVEEVKVVEKVAVKAKPQESKVTTGAEVKRTLNEDKKIVFKVQFLTSSKVLEMSDTRLKGLKGIEYYKEGGIYKFTYGPSEDYNEVLRTKQKISGLFKDAFIIAFCDGVKMNISEAIKVFKSKKN